jgi:hypothetical protein
MAISSFSDHLLSLVCHGSERRIAAVSKATSYREARQALKHSYVRSAESSFRTLYRANAHLSPQSAEMRQLQYAALDYAVSHLRGRSSFALKKITRTARTVVVASWFEAVTNTDGKQVARRFMAVDVHANVEEQAAAMKIKLHNHIVEQKWYAAQLTSKGSEGAELVAWPFAKGVDMPEGVVYALIGRS